MHLVRHLPPFCLHSALGRVRSLSFFVTGSVLRCTLVGCAAASLHAPLGLLIHAGELGDAGWLRSHGTGAAGCCEGSHNPGNATTSHGTASCKGHVPSIRSSAARPCLSSAWSRPSLSSSRCRSWTSSGCSCGTCSSRPVCRYYYHAFSCNSFLLLHDSPPTPHAQHALFHTPFLLSIVSVSVFRRWSSAQTCFRMPAGSQPQAAGGPTRRPQQAA